MKLRRARMADAYDIHEIALENSLKNLEEVESSNGFLVSAYELEDYQAMLKSFEHFYVIEIKGHVKAFVFAYNQDQLDSNLIINQKILDRHDDTFLIIKQVCVAQDVQSKGYGSALYEHILESVGVPIYASIVAEPYNEASVHFHLKHRFKKVFTLEAEDGIERMVYCNCSAEHDGSYDSQILEQQYQTAVNLYMHEDNLNWSKLNNLFYISGGLVAVISILASLASANLLYSIIIVSLLGIISSILFSIAITSGVVYMNNRKKTVMDIETLLINNKGTKVVLPKVGASAAMLKRSPTSNVMINIPRLIVFIWILVFLLAAGAGFLI